MQGVMVYGRLDRFTPNFGESGARDSNAPSTNDALEFIVARVLMSRFSRFAPADQVQSVRKPKETRSVSEGFFDFSKKPSTRYATNTSASRHP